MDHFDFMAPFYDRLAAKPDMGHFQQLLKLPCDGRLLDAGGGTARISSHLSGLIRQVVVSDLSYRMLKQASRKPVLPVGARVEQLPFPDETFDRILIVDALHHFSDQHGALRDLLRVLKGGGRLVIEEYDLSHMGVKLLALAEKILGMGSRFLRLDEISAMIDANGVCAKIEHSSRFTACIIADKK
ncbi:MAG: methyltransferase domain-containing protein [Desulfobacterales bacterium]|jgi:demethylmenaquinone methyltransferase/2-methoxy-6-polyprenyl-1,4-benzoquinol methylase